MAPERSSIIKQHLDAILDIPAAERESYLDRVCAGDPLLRSEIDRHLREVAARVQFVDPAVQPAYSLAPGDVVAGRYRITRLIGRGGEHMASADPVIIDDGGSTRIKQLKDSVFMDRLLDTGTDVADGEFAKPAGAFNCTMKIRYHEKNGAQQIVERVLVSGDKVTIESENLQVATLTIDTTTFKMTVALSSSVAGVVPIVEAKQSKAQRRYVVTNAGSIAKVTVTNAGVPTVLFPEVGGNPSIYTMIHLAPV